MAETAERATLEIPKPGKEARKIRAMFEDISGRYDFLNRLLSGRSDVAWRKLVVREVVTPEQRMILDLACGTGDLALEIRKSAHPDCYIAGADFTRGMLRIARKKTPANTSRLSWLEADGLQLPFQDNQFDLITIAFGIRNMESLESALKEILRVLKPGGKLAILEFTQPDNWLVRKLYMPYFIHVLPRIGALLSQKSAYLYLPQSVLHFPNRRQLAAKMKRSGYSTVRHCAMCLGIAAVHIGEKKQPTTNPSAGRS